MKRNVIRLISIIMLGILLITIFSEMVCVEANGDIEMDKNTINLRIYALLNIAEVIGVCATVIMLVVVMIKYILAASESKEKIKKHMIKCVVLAFIILNVIGIYEIIKRPCRMIDTRVGAQ